MRTRGGCDRLATSVVLLALGAASLLAQGCTQEIIFTAAQPEEDGGPEQAEVTGEIELLELTEPGRPKRFRTIWRVELQELAGVDVTINFARLEIWNRDFDQTERSELGGKDIASQCGSRVIPGRSEWTCELPFEFNIDNLEGRLKLTIGMVDALGNAHEVVFDTEEAASDS